jgi:hypothetical protein
MFETIVAQAVMDSIKDKIDLFVTISSDSNSVNGSSVMHPIDVHQVQTHGLADSSGGASLPKGCPAPAGCPGAYDSAKVEWHCCPVNLPSGSAPPAELSGADFWKGTWNPEFKWNPLVTSGSSWSITFLCFGLIICSCRSPMGKPALLPLRKVRVRSHHSRLPPRRLRAIPCSRTQFRPKISIPGPANPCPLILPALNPLGPAGQPLHPRPPLPQRRPPPRLRTSSLPTPPSSKSSIRSSRWIRWTRRAPSPRPVTPAATPGAPPTVAARTRPSPSRRTTPPSQPAPHRPRIRRWW